MINEMNLNNIFIIQKIKMYLFEQRFWMEKTFSKLLTIVISLLLSIII